MSSKSLSLKIHKMRIAAEKRKTLSNVESISYPTLPRSLEEDYSTISFSKKVGGQFSQFYRLQKNLKKEFKDDFFKALSKRYLPISTDKDYIKSSVINLDYYFESESFFGLEGVCTEWKEEGGQYEEFFQVLLQIRELNTIRSFRFKGETYRGKLLWEGLNPGKSKDVLPGLRVRRLSRIRYQIINLTDEEVEVEFINMKEDLVLPLVFKEVLKKECQRQTLRVFDIKFKLEPFEPGKENYLRVKD